MFSTVEKGVKPKFEFTNNTLLRVNRHKCLRNSFVKIKYPAKSFSDSSRFAVLLALSLLLNPEIQEKMIAGRMKKYLKEITLLGQPFVKDPDQSVEKYLAGARASVSAFSRFEVGEGIDKRAENIAE